jgi:hypothetical protein
MIAMSQHALRRAKQRGISRDTIELVLDHADIERHVGQSCRLYRVSRHLAGALTAPDKLARVAVIWSDRRSEVVTVMPVHRNASGRRCRSRH